MKGTNNILCHLWVSTVLGISLSPDSLAPQHPNFAGRPTFALCVCEKHILTSPCQQKQMHSRGKNVSHRHWPGASLMKWL